jgi:UDP-N-acetylmuramate--alanine ligase
MNEHVTGSNGRSGLSSSTGGQGIKVVYFLGIGGIGMSAVARYFHSKGVAVSGYDKTPTDLTKELEAAGITVYYNEDVNRIPKDVDLGDIHTCSAR